MKKLLLCICLAIHCMYSLAQDSTFTQGIFRIRVKDTVVAYTLTDSIVRTFAYVSLNREINKFITLVNHAYLRIPGIIKFGGKDINVIIDKEGFRGCSFIHELTLEEGVERIYSDAFADCHELRSVSIPSTMEDVSWTAFNGCFQLSGITVDKDNEYLDSRGNCNAIIRKDCDVLIVGCKNTRIPNDVAYIGMCAFSGQERLEHIDLPESVRKIESGAFEDCTSLTDIKLPDSLEEISGGVFMGCTKLKSIFIPKNVSKIYASLFRGCSSLTEIIVDEDNPVYDSRDNCNAIIETKTNKLLNSCPTTTIVDGIQDIESFSGENLTVPASVTKINPFAFSHCPLLKSIVVDKGNKNYDSRNDCNAIIDTQKSTLIVGCAATEIPAGVIKIGDRAFEGRFMNETMIIPNDVEMIGRRAFADCKNLKCIVAHSVRQIQSGAFERCYDLCDVRIKNSNMRTLESCVFADCINLKRVELPSELRMIERGAFEGCTNLEYVVIPQYLTTIEEDAFKGCKINTSFH